jgi:hypothetical protein
VTFFLPFGLRLFFILLKIKETLFKSPCHGFAACLLEVCFTHCFHHLGPFAQLELSHPAQGCGTAADSNGKRQHMILLG